MAPNLSPSAYPEIWERVLSYLWFYQLRRIRPVSSMMCYLADQKLGDRGWLLIKRSGKVDYFFSHDDIVPCFHPEGSLASQYAVMKQTQHVILSYDLPPSPRLKDLLQQLPPSCEVDMHHEFGRHPCFQLPTISSLEIWLRAQCDCACASTTLDHFQHAAKTLILRIDGYVDPSERQRISQNCEVVHNLINLHVENLLIRTDSFGALVTSGLAANAAHRRLRNPRLKVTVFCNEVDYGSKGSFTAEDIRDAFAKNLHIDPVRIVFQGADDFWNRDR